MASKTVKITQTPLSVEDVRWIAQNARPAVTPCLCGCDQSTKGRFFPGHDAILKARLTATATNGTAAAKRQANAALEVFGW